MNCPNCNVQLIVSERLNVEIDYCPNCRGAWLDRGELDKIIERSTHPRSDNWPDSERRLDRKKKQQSFLRELFDF
jgi:Zn-finger nucleic acid-binding protein